MDKDLKVAPEEIPEESVELTDEEKERAEKREKMRAVIRRMQGRYWTFLLYPSSCASNWREILTNAHVNALISPLHHGVKSATGEERVDHYHGMVMYDANKTGAQVMRLLDAMGAHYSLLPDEFQVGSPRAMARYMTHMDNPEKEQFAADERPEVFGCVDYDELVARDSDNDRRACEMLEFAMSEECEARDWFEFVAYAKDERRDWFELLATRACPQVKDVIYWREKHRRQAMRDDMWRWLGVDPALAEALGLKVDMAAAARYLGALQGTEETRRVSELWRAGVAATGDYGAILSGAKPSDEDGE